ncbi:MAG: hypothetical protein PWP23_2629 [Candidatus Sumerlaeota bacterium]|nr:hypothetical protein [Candidatus Sumerlaeota bacterium]
MRVEHLEVFVEEPSMEAALGILLPRVLGESVSYAIYNMGDKLQLLERLPGRLRAYASWLPASWRILVLVDRDRDDCRELKQKLEAAAREAGLPTSSCRNHGTWYVANRIVVEELENWFFGDPDALRKAYPRIPRNLEAGAKFRDPDNIPFTWETIEKELRKRGYFKAGLAKIELARNVAPHMIPERNRSRSFQVFLRTLTECMTSA